MAEDPPEKPIPPRDQLFDQFGIFYQMKVMKEAAVSLKGVQGDDFRPLFFLRLQEASARYPIEQFYDDLRSKNHHSGIEFSPLGEVVPAYVEAFRREAARLEKRGNADRARAVLQAARPVEEAGKRLGLIPQESLGKPAKKSRRRPSSI